MENNPLKQYFRRPAFYFKLPSNGIYYDQNVVENSENGELAVYAMTAADEMAIRTPDAAFNGAAVGELIRSCIPGILQPWKINTIDIEAILIAIKAASNNGKMEIAAVCPNCQHESAHDVVIKKILDKTRGSEYGSMLDIGDLKIKFRPLTFAETNKNDIRQLEIQRIIAPLANDYDDDQEKQQQMTAALRQMNDLITDVICSTIEYIQTPETQVYEPEFIHEFLTSTDKQTTEMIKSFSVGLREKSDMEPLKIQCTNCNHQFEQKIMMGINDLFD
jgi:hypothetical protein